MKKIYSIFLLFALFVGCKEEEKVKIGSSDSHVAPVLIETPTADTVSILKEEDADNVFTTVTWTAADFGVSTEIIYSLVATAEGFDGESVINTVTGSSTSSTVTVKEMNTALINITKYVNEAQVDTLNISITVTAYMSNETVVDANATSQASSFRALPYYTPQLPSNKIWVRGNHQGWSENDDTTILGSTEDSGGPYTGYMYLDGGFKVCELPTWSGKNYGAKVEPTPWETDGNGQKVEISTSDAGGGDSKNLATEEAGMYFMNTDLSTSLYVEKLVFKIEGSAVSAPVTMEWDPKERVLFANVDFLEGTYTFKANDDHNLGMGSQAGLASNGGEPISVTAGNKVIVLDLKVPGNLSYFYAGAVSSTPPVLTAPTTTTLVLEKDNADNDVETLNWSAAEYGDETLESYVVMLGSQTLATLTNGETSYTAKVKDLNIAALAEGGTPGTAADYEVVIKAMFTNENEISSEAVVMNLTPYEAFQPKVWLVGSATPAGWTHNDEVVLNLTGANDGTYNNAFWMNAEEFKVTSQGDWNGTNYGYASDGNLSTDGGAGNIPVASANHYIVEVNTENLTYSLTPLEWGIIGSATAGGWDSQTNATTFDATAMTWTWSGVTLTGSAESSPEFKFRANDNWSYNFGSTDTEGALVHDGGNIPVTSDGTYDIVMSYDAETRTFSYTITKQ
ncbi:SusF/SusE family outer membrane protein [Flammeovirga sp. SJP92]|uniref:SusF/SusE family outer membrane protein n=1 Tax=Flammeovirga sp. SJP92 TaxID=1775430 RepID=UPI000787FB7E|nr:SusF/SusE family outer membrane protein [Flammeovirga sp. SJP92]KXX67370.1 hypothetical protein AVL50_27115 [Flammeovirga sp. SJP92]